MNKSQVTEFFNSLLEGHVIELGDTVGVKIGVFTDSKKLVKALYANSGYDFCLGIKRSKTAMVHGAIFFTKDYTDTVRLGTFTESVESLRPTR